MIQITLKAALCGLVLVGSGLLGSAALAEKGYYKWIDERGNPHHSDRPPPLGVEYEFVSTDSGLSRRVSREESRADMEAPADPDRKQAAMPTPEQQAAIEKNPDLCDQARSNLDTLNSNARVRIRDDDGIRYLTEEEKEVQREKARNLIAVHCN